MSLYSNWTDLANQEREQEAYNAFWDTYLSKEQVIYEAILDSPETIISDKLSTLANKYNMDDAIFSGFMDGINSSLKESVDLDTLTSDSTITLDVDLEKLYFNMLSAKADWLYNLPAWDNILTEDKKKAITKAYNATKTVVKEKTVGRNAPCPCGSGRKYKHCCLNK